MAVETDLHVEPFAPGFVRCGHDHGWNPRFHFREPAHADQELHDGRTLCGRAETQLLARLDELVGGTESLRFRRGAEANRLVVGERRCR